MNWDNLLQYSSRAHNADGWLTNVEMLLTQSFQINSSKRICSLQNQKCVVVNRVCNIQGAAVRKLDVQ